MTVLSEGRSVFGGLAFCLIVSIVFVVRRVWFHSLSKHPGPKLWAASRLPYVISLLRGNLNRDMLEIHRKYGDIVRLAPDELSFATADAWGDIYMHRPGHKEPKKDPTWYIAPNDMPQNIVTTTDINVRARMRRLLAPSFNEISLRNQAPVIERYAGMVIERLNILYDTQRKEGQPAVVNFLDWVNFYTTDIIGDLALGESFHCLDDGSYHPWVRNLYNFFKGMIFASAARFFPAFNFLLERMIPRKILEMQRQHTEFTNTKILQRLELDTDRPDLITPFLKDMNKSPDKMSLGEIQSTFAVIIVAGSEATATTLTGIFHKLASHPHIQDKLWRQIQGTFTSEDEITVSSTGHINYLDAIIHEALRLCYAVPGGLPRISPEGGDTYAGQFIPAGTQIAIRPYVVLHSEKYFKNPWDFVPERWLPESERPKEYASDCLSASQPFSVGPTSCIGKPLAWAEMRVLITRIIWNFELSMAEGKPFSWEKLRMMMIVEKSPLWLTLDRRPH